MNFRKVLFALTVMALFAGFASAQVVLQPMSCTLGSTNATIRAESKTDVAGDLVITCTGGMTPTSGNQADYADILVDLQGVQITSKKFASFSEALLTVDEPGSNGTPGLPWAGYGSNALLSICADPTGSAAAACATYNALKNSTGTDYWVADSNNTGTGGQSPNGFVGTLITPTGGSFPTQIKFAGVPLIAPVTSGVSRVFRITNVRVNPNGATAVSAKITVTPKQGLTTMAFTGSNIAQIATPAAGMSASGSGATSITSAFSQCLPTTLTSTAPVPNVMLLNFKEGFQNAFKPRMIATSTATAMSGTVPTFVVGTSNPAQLVLGGSQANSESGIVQTVGGNAIGLADFGTRLKANFANLDKNATYYVSLNNVKNFTSEAGTIPTTIGDTTAKAYAQLLPQANAETAAYAAATAAATKANSVAGVGGVNVVALTRATDGTAQATWEVTNADPSSSETFTFAVYVTFNANGPAVNNTSSVPLPTVSLAFAPTEYPSTATVPNTTSVPRFAAGASAGPTSFGTMLPCQTSLLFPYVTGDATFATGIAISNTSQDPFGTTTSKGTCKLSFFGATTKWGTTAAGAAAYTTPEIPAGVTWAGLLGGVPANTLADTFTNTSTLLVNATGDAFGGTGYMVATCNFQYAHGFAYILTNGGTPAQAAMGYTANVLTGTARSNILVGEGLTN